MICTNLEFDPLRDKSRVIPGRSINLREAFKTGIVKSTGSEDEFNDIDDPENIGTRIEDNFDAINQQRYIRSALDRAAMNAPNPNSAAAQAAANPSANPSEGEGV